MKKTNKNVSRNALELAFADYANVSHLINDVIAVATNTKWLHDKLITDRRTKVHSVAYQALFEIVEISGQLPIGYYVSSPQMKQFLLDRFGQDYRTLLIDAVKSLEIIRNRHLGD